jgi:hypothetical protein
MSNSPPSISRPEACLKLIDQIGQIVKSFPTLNQFTQTDQIAWICADLIAAENSEYGQKCMGMLQDGITATKAGSRASD